MLARVRVWPFVGRTLSLPITLALVLAGSARRGSKGELRSE